MRHANTVLRLHFAALAVAVSGLWLVGPVALEAQDSFEVRELRAGLKVAQEQLETERKRTDESEIGRLAMVKSLAEAVRVSEEQTTAARETELKLQALGVDLINQDENALEQRLLKAVRDLDIAQQEIERQSSVIHRLGESQLKLIKSSTQLSISERNEAETALAAADKALVASEAGNADPVDLSKARVVSIDSGIGLVVFDAGRRSGIRVGTPVTILRGDRPLYSAMIVDVRESITGAVLQDRMADAGEVEVGDGIRLLPEQNPL